MQKVNVSILMPSLNVGPFIREALESVVSQTLREIEIICIDAGSTDGTLETIREFAARDSRIRVIMSEKRSYGYQMNLGLDAAQGEYVGIIETDDAASANQFERMYELASANRLDILKSNYRKFTGSGETRESTLVRCCGNPSLFGKVINPADHPEVVTFSLNQSSLFSLAFVRKHGIRFNETPGASYQDVGFYLQTHLLAKRVMCCEEPFYWYRIDNPGSSINNSGKMYMVCGEIDFARRHLQEALDDRGWNAVKTVFGRELFYSYMSTLRRISPEARREFVLRFSADLKAAYGRGEISRAHFNDKNWRVVLDLAMMPMTYLDRAYPEDRLPEDRPVVVSLTTWPKRIETVYKVVDNMLTQTRRPDKVVLYLADEEFPGHVLPETLTLRLARDPRFEVRYVPNVRSHKKYISVFKDFPDALVILVDDDIVYPDSMIRDLLTQHGRTPHAVVALRTHVLSFRKNGGFAKYREWMKERKILRKPTPLALATTGGGTLFPAGIFGDEVFDLEKIKAVAPTADDLWLKFQMMRAGVPVVWIDCYRSATLKLIPGTQTETLCEENVGNDGNDRIWEAIQRLHPEESAVLRALMFEQFLLENPGRFTSPLAHVGVKMRGARLCLRENGLVYTIFHALAKVTGAMTSGLTKLERYGSTPKVSAPARRAPARRPAPPGEPHPAVSVILPVYNAADYLAESLDSVLGQTLRNIEVICVDDGSTDESLRLLCDYAAADPRLTVVTQKNAGASAARNKGLALAKGDYVMFMDPDDLYPDKTSLQRLHLAASSARLLAACGFFERFDPADPDTIERPQAYHFTPGVHVYAERPMDFGYQMYMLSRLMLVREGIRFPPVSRYQDPLFLIRALTAAQRFVAVEVASYRYRLGHQQINWAKNDFQKFRDMLGQMREILVFAKERRLTGIVVRTKTRLLNDYRPLLTEQVGDVFSFPEFTALLAEFSPEDAEEIRSALVSQTVK